MLRLNNNQRKLLLFCLGILLLTVIFVPQEMSWIIGGEGDWNSKTQFIGYCLIWKVKGEIAMKHLFVEWTALLIFFSGMFIYLKED